MKASIVSRFTQKRADFRTGGVLFEQNNILFTPAIVVIRVYSACHWNVYFRTKIVPHSRPGAKTSDTSYRSIQFAGHLQVGCVKYNPCNARPNDHALLEQITRI